MQTQRLILEPLSLKHLPEYFRLASNPAVMKYIRAPAADLADAETRLMRYVNYAAQTNGLGAFALITREDKRFIGVGVLIHMELKVECGKVEVGYQFYPEEWGKGYAQEFTRALLRYGFETLGLLEIFGTTHKDHVVSQKILMKCGLKPIGRLDVHGGSEGFLIKKPQTHIRLATSTDASILCEAEKKIAQTPGQLVSHPHELKLENFQHRIQQLNSKNEGLYVVLENEGVIQGHALLEKIGPERLSHVLRLTLAVHEGAQGQGVGKKLMLHVVDWAKNKPDVEKIELNVRAVNLRAIKLYESLGFKHEGRWSGRVKLTETDYVDDLCMGLWVKPRGNG